MKSCHTYQTKIEHVQQYLEKYVLKGDNINVLYLKIYFTATLLFVQSWIFHEMAEKREFCLIFVQAKYI